MSLDDHDAMVINPNVTVSLEIHAFDCRGSELQAMLNHDVAKFRHLGILGGELGQGERQITN